MTFLTLKRGDTRTLTSSVGFVWDLQVCIAGDSTDVVTLLSGYGLIDADISVSTP